MYRIEDKKMLVGVAICARTEIYTIFVLSACGNIYFGDIVAEDKDVVLKKKNWRWEFFY